MHMPPSCVRSVFQPLQSFFNLLKPEWLEHLVTPPRSGCGVGLQNLGTRFLRWLLLWRETSQEHYSLKCCLFYSLLSCWVRTRVVAISLMKLTFPAACFLHVKNSCNWRNYLGQKLRVNTSISSAYFVNIFQPGSGSFIPSDCKGYQKAGQATAICIPGERTHPSRLFLQTGQKSVGGWFSAGNQREGGFLPSLTETLPLHQQPWEAFTAVLYSWGHFSRQNLPDRPGSDAAGRFSAQSPQCHCQAGTTCGASSQRIWPRIIFS